MSDEVRSQRGEANPARGAYERGDMDPKAARLTILGLGGVVALVALGVAALFFWLGAIRQPDVPALRPAAPAPALQVNERNDRVQIEAHARARLEGRDGGVPIDQAMRRTATLGWDAPR